MYAIFQLAGFQYRAEEGAVIQVPRQAAKQGEKLNISDVLLVNANGASVIGTPFVSGAKIEAEVLDHTRGEKLVGFKYKRRTKYRRTLGHRQDYTEIKVNKIVSPKS
ncbi:MAG: 50S ribosomal protein L21 [bacterium]|nr:50S ribosomal protein L21 [bacterium]